jgi:hypothetical protein
MSTALIVLRVQRILAHQKRCELRVDHQPRDIGTEASVADPHQAVVRLNFYD